MGVNEITRRGALKMKAEDRALGATHRWEGEEQEDGGPGGNQSSQDVGEREPFLLPPPTLRRASAPPHLCEQDHRRLRGCPGICPVSPPMLHRATGSTTHSGDWFPYPSFWLQPCRAVSGRGKHDHHRG